MYYSLAEASRHIGPLEHLPISIKILLENLLRFEDGVTISLDHLKALRSSLKVSSPSEILFHPARILSQDLAGVPLIVDLAAMREAAIELGGSPEDVSPSIPVDLIVDHSIIADHYGTTDSLNRNMKLELQRNQERFRLLRWAQNAFTNLRLVPPGKGICHQINLEYLSRVVWVSANSLGSRLAYPDTVLGTDSHTTMVNALGVLGWGVGGIEAEAAMLGQPLAMTIPEVLGVRLMGCLPAVANATDLVLTLTQLLRSKGVVGKFVEFCGPGLQSLTVEDRATVANMAPDYGATCGFFPVGPGTLDYLRRTGRDATVINLVEAYSRLQGLWVDPTTPEPQFSDTVEVDLTAVEPCVAGPRRPQDRIPLTQVAATFKKDVLRERRTLPVSELSPPTLTDGAIVIAAITSCTNTSNPHLLIAAGLLAAKARALGLTRKPWVKTSLAPGSRVVTEYLERAGLQKHLDALGFSVVGYGCTTCLGNSGPLAPEASAALQRQDLVAVAILSGNRNFEGRVHPQVRAAFLASPPLVVAYSIAGTVNIDLMSQPLGCSRDGQQVMLRDLWPTGEEISQIVLENVSTEIFRDRYYDLFKGDSGWQEIDVPNSPTYPWTGKSTYIAKPPFFEYINSENPQICSIRGAHALAVVGDSFTTDHMSPAGDIALDSPAGRYLNGLGLSKEEFNSYGARRGNHEVMMRGTLANPRVKNELIAPKEGGFTIFAPDGRTLPIFDAAMEYQRSDTPLILVGGKEFGTGSSRDWAAKGLKLLGVKVVLAESFERIHRANLVAMGIIPLQLEAGFGRSDLGLTGRESIDLEGLEPSSTDTRVRLTINRIDGSRLDVLVNARIETKREMEYLSHGGILYYVLRQLMARAPAATEVKPGT